MESLKLLFGLYHRPLRSFSAVIDQGGFFFSLISAILVNFLLIVVLAGQLGRPHAETAPQQDPSPQEEPASSSLKVPISLSPSSAVTILIPVALAFVPAAIIIAAKWDGLGGTGVVLQRDYMPMLVCTLMAWTAANLPFAIIGLLAREQLKSLPSSALALLGGGQVVFLGFSVCAVRTVMGSMWERAVAVALGAWIAMAVGLQLYGVLGNFAGYFMSPFLLYWAYVLLNQDIRALAGGLGSRRNLKRHLEACTVNPRDADAHYQLGLIYQQRRNYTEAIARFERAIGIEPGEVDAHYQLGRIAREQKRWADARTHLAAALALDEKHSSNEVWRDLGATDLELGKTDLALTELQKYVDRREYDPAGQFWLGQALAKLGRNEVARECFERSIEAARTAPPHLRAQAGRWSSQSKAALKKL